MIADVQAIIKPRLTADGRPFSEILHTWRESGVLRHALSRVWWPLPDTPHARAAEVEAFKKRRAVHG